jgi:C2 domain of PTEN tumour-suppressor protein
VVECMHLTKDDLTGGEIMFRFMFNTAFVQSNMVTFTRDELDIAWNGKDKFQEDFKIEVYLTSFKFNSLNSFPV